MTPLFVLWIYLAAINLALFAVMGIDKARARRRKMRVPEAALYMLALAGGSVGGIFGMLAFRHKTRHASFYLGFPLILIAQVGLALLVIRLVTAAG